MFNEYSIAIHGGAGAMSKGKLTPEQEQEIEDILKGIIEAGLASLQDGANALDVVQAAVNQLEDCTWFNAGKGAVFNHEGKHELDASIMCGKSLDAGAVSGIRFSPNPIDVARAVMDKSPHVYLGGEGAEQFVRDLGLAQVENTYFSTEMRYQQLQSALKAQEVILEPTDNDYKYGTVGAVAKDKYGNLAAATSTGGITNKQYGRIGDSPVIGSGTYANNQTCAVSATGHGEHFLRHVVGYNISARMLLASESLVQAAKHVVFDDLPSTGGSGGVIAVDSHGNLTLPFNTEGMYRGWGGSNEPAQSKIYE
ncbi:isoaspartyl peptidase/L-asparaginase [Vibrio parahaemolyticus]|uniref:isoaspartyl peptidase/L-asparaginase family protein n=1 Tax=Vibrio TaxID=662 RepID=UPI001A8D4D1B|nr:MULTISPECIES: isoaspartyl peptidase/L-asparaginase [Vibrio]EGQ7975980.1 isoaspartyl peptidase/L-asparaginase [Vibrio parahaemolyticus]MBO0211543.1 isoaspartyl peptidase/L-asparaginase [Vibrio sp. Vb0877]MCR9807901.1 isoaspartyl peptidase/L-asparaginase [Vibrio parahaemolyticus]